MTQWLELTYWTRLDRTPTASDAWKRSPHGGSWTPIRGKLTLYWRVVSLYQAKFCICAIHFVSNLYSHRIHFDEVARLREGLKKSKSVEFSTPWLTASVGVENSTLFLIILNPSFSQYLSEEYHQLQDVLWGSGYSKLYSGQKFESFLTSQ